MVGHLLYGSLVGAIALFSAAVSESAATAAIIALAFTIGSWVLDFAVAGRPGLPDGSHDSRSPKDCVPSSRDCFLRVCWLA